MAKVEKSQDTPTEGRLELRIKAAKLRKPVMLKHWTTS